MQRYVNTLTDLLGKDAVSDLDRTNAARTDLISHGVPTLSDPNTIVYFGAEF